MHIVSGDALYKALEEMGLFSTSPSRTRECTLVMEPGKAVHIDIRLFLHVDDLPMLAEALTRLHGELERVATVNFPPAETMQGGVDTRHIGSKE